MVRGAWGAGVVMERALQRAGLYFVRESKLPKVSRNVLEKFTLAAEKHGGFGGEC